MSIVLKAVELLFPFRKSAKQQMKSAADGAHWMREGIARLKNNPITDGTAPRDIADARARFMESAARYGRSSADSLRAIEQDFARRQMVSIIAALVCVSIGIAGVILMWMTGFWTGFGLSLGVPLGAYASVSALRFGLRRYQVRNRALVPLPVYVEAAGGWLHAVTFMVENQCPLALPGEAQRRREA